MLAMWGMLDHRRHMTTVTQDRCRPNGPWQVLRGLIGHGLVPRIGSHNGIGRLSHKPAAAGRHEWSGIAARGGIARGIFCHAVIGRLGVSCLFGNLTGLFEGDQGRASARPFTARLTIYTQKAKCQ